MCSSDLDASALSTPASRAVARSVPLATSARVRRRSRADALRAAHSRCQYRLEWEGIHGARHWARVLRNGLELAALTQARADVVALFAVFHDACRHNDDRHPQHGPRGAALARDFHGRHFQLDSSGLTLLTVACETHTTGTDHPDITVRACWDADRLDLWRVGTRPHPRRLTTEPAQQQEFIRAIMERSEQDDFPYRKRFAVAPGITPGRR